MLKFIIAVLLMCSTSYGGFILDSLDEAKELSKLTKQPILVIFGGDNCSFCNQLKNDISNGQLTTALDPYIICYIDLKQDQTYKEQYRITVIPDSRIISKNKETSKATGYTKEKYIQWLKNAKR
jgi:thioredoxin-related protein